MAHAYSTDKNINELVKLVVKTQGITLKHGGKHLAMLLPDDACAQLSVPFTDDTHDVVVWWNSLTLVEKDRSRDESKTRPAWPTE